MTFEFNDEEELEAFLEHHGVKGMKWGHRKAHRLENKAARRENVASRRPTKRNVRKANKAEDRADWQNRHLQNPRSRKQKVAIAAAGTAGFLVAANLVTLKTMNVKVGLIGGAGGAVVGAKAAARMIDKHGSTPLADVHTHGRR